ncbi:MAG TPA: hypothetical protein VF614_16355 [Chthoniobacteraceae bacterium]|jgi:hypothetical protein
MTRHLILATICAALSASAADAAGNLGIDDPLHGYYTREPQDRFTRFLADLEAGRRTLDSSGELPFLTSLLRELEVPISSQMLVYSVTSLQKGLISPRRPRALYFNDDTYVGYVPGGQIEIISLDPALGGIFFISDPVRSDRKPTFERSDECMTCHAPRYLDHVPGLMIESVVPGITGGGERAFRRQQSGHGIPLGNRFGGYHVTGVAAGFPKNWGNLLLDRADGVLREIPIPAGQLFSFTRYPAETSDALAQLLHEHQVGFVNRALQASYRTRVLIGETSADSAAGATELEALARELVRYILFADEVPLIPGSVTSDPAFQEAFLSTAKRANGAALKELDGSTRLLRYRCSYMIYSPAFSGIPGPLKENVLAQLRTALDGAAPEFAYLPTDEKATIRAILHETLPGFAASSSGT